MQKISAQARSGLRAQRPQDVIRPAVRAFSFEHSEDPSKYGHMSIKERLKDFDRTRSGHFIPLKPSDNVKQLQEFDHHELSRKKFVKAIRTPNGMYNQIYDVLQHDLRNKITQEELTALQDKQSLTGKDKTGFGNDNLLTEEERRGLFDTLLTNTIFPKEVSKYVEKVTKATMLFPNTIYQHMTAGLGNYISQKTGKPVEECFRFVGYYRSGVIMEELYRMGFTRDEAITMVAKEHFLQYHNGDPFGPNRDPHIFNPFKRTFYPCESHISEGSTDLGRDHEIETARLFCHAYEGHTAPVTVMATGDTGFFTDGALNSVQHLVEASERGFKMPLIYLVNMNNSAISTRLDKGRTYGMDDQDVCLMKLENRFAQYGDLIEPGFVNRANDMREGITEMRQAVDQVLETGKPTYVISSFPFRPGGHASDANPAPEPVILDEFAKSREIFLSQIAAAAPPGCTPVELADMIQEFRDKVDEETEKAIRGSHYLTKDEAREISQPGITTTLAKEPGQIIGMSADYLCNRNVSEFGGMGSEIYGKTINAQFDMAEAAGRECRYVHQENHYAGANDTRGGVYGELNSVEAKHTTKFVNIMPQEAQVMQLGVAFRMALPKNNLIFVKGPHTIFNEHCRDVMKYGSMLMCDRGLPGNCIYLFDGGSIANFEQFKFKDPVTGEDKERNMWLARVGEHHNTPEYSSFAADANTVVCTPMDMNLLSKCMPEMVRLYDMGRFLCCVAPTASFGFLHPKFNSSAGENAVMGINDMIKVELQGTTPPKTGRKLFVISYGPDSKWVAKTLDEQGIQCEMFVLNYNRCPNVLVSTLQQYADQEIDILLVEQNSNAALYGPVMTDLKQKLGYPRKWHWQDCTAPHTYIPYGYGENLLQKSDLMETLGDMGVIAGGGGAKFVAPTGTSAPAAAAAAAPSGGSGGGSQVVMAPMDGEGVYITFQKAVGDKVSKDDVIMEVESDKATIDIKAPADGVITEFFVEEQEEMDVTGGSTKMFAMDSAGGGGAPAAAAPSGGGGGGEVITVNAPMDGEGVYITFVKQVGDAVSKDDVIMEVESDKATIEIKAPQDGVIEKMLVEEQEEMDVGPSTQLCTIATSGGGGGAAPAAPAPSGGGGDLTTVNAPMDGEGVYITFIRKVGDSVAKDDVIMEVESDKATIEIKAPKDGVIKEFLVEEQEEMDVGPSTKLAVIEGGSGGGGAAPAAAAPAAAAPAKDDGKAKKPKPGDVIMQPNGDKHVVLTRTGVGMVKAMTIKPDDTRTFNQFDSTDFGKIRGIGKEHGVTPPIVMVKHLGHALEELDLNKKLDGERRTQIFRKQVDIGIAVDVGFGLRTCVVRDVTNKTYAQINEDVQGFVAAGAKLPAEDQDLTTVGWSVTSIGKGAARFAVSVLPPGTSGILSIGRMAGNNGDDTMLSLCMCHASLTGVEGSSILHKVRNSFEKSY